MGKQSAENANKKFIYVAITAEYYKDKTKYSKYENKDFLFIWTNWQAVASFIEKKLIEKNLRWSTEFASDLHSLLVKKRLRSYIGIANLRQEYNFNYPLTVFYNIKSSKFKGEFSGFFENLRGFRQIKPYQRIFRKSFFKNLKSLNVYPIKKIFYNGN